jgi:hypothetical protein
MNKLTSIVMDDIDIDIHANHVTKLWYIVHPNNDVIRQCRECLKFVWEIT